MKYRKYNKPNLYLLNLLLLLTVVNVAAQSNFQTGSVITNKQDTLTGLIDYNVTDFTRYTMQSIAMKRSANDKNPITYTAADLKSFFVLPDHLYLVYKGRVSNNKNQSVDNQQDTTTSFTTMFLQRIANGPNASLYVNTDRLKTRFFYRKKIMCLLNYYITITEPRQKKRIPLLFTPASLQKFITVTTVQIIMI